MLTRDLVFSRIIVDYASPQFARVSWDFVPNFIDPEPYLTHLQFGYTGNPDAEDWTDVGTPQENAFVVIDTTKRYQTKEWDLHYRVVLTTPKGAYYSEPVAAYGVLNRRDWLLAREIIRQNTLLHRKLTGWDGFLLKRKRRGEVPATESATTRVTDPLTDEIVTTKRPVTAGTEFVGGYFTPVPIYLELTPQTHYPARQSQEGTADRVSQWARAVAFPELSHNDVFVHAKSDRRYAIRPLKVAAVHRGTALLVDVELRQLEATDPVYGIPVN